MELRDYLNEREIQASSFAASIGVSVTTLYRYMARDRTPRRQIMALIADKTGGAVQPNDFFAVQANAPIGVRTGAQP